MDNIMSHKMILKELAKRIKILRLRKNWSRQDLADRAQVNVYSLKRFETSGQIALERFLAICSALEVLDDFKCILKPRERIDVNAWKAPPGLSRQRGGRCRVKESVKT